MCLLVYKAEVCVCAEMRYPYDILYEYVQEKL